MMANLNDLYNQRNQFFKQKQDEAIGNVNAQNQQQQDALQRRFTSMGAANTGAAISAQQKQSEAAAAQTRQVQNDIAGQQAQANDVDIGRQFQSEEAQKGRDFSGREAQAGRDFSKGMSEQDMAFKQKIYDVEQQKHVLCFEDHYGHAPQPRDQEANDPNCNYEFFFTSPDAPLIPVKQAHLLLKTLDQVRHRSDIFVSNEENQQVYVGKRGF
jgi:hypothetical protein